jgi:hypothetical protein
MPQHENYKRNCLPSPLSDLLRARVDSYTVALLTLVIPGMFLRLVLAKAILLRCMMASPLYRRSQWQDQSIFQQLLVVVHLFSFML